MNDKFNFQTDSDANNYKFRILEYESGFEYNSMKSADGASSPYYDTKWILTVAISFIGAIFHFANDKKRT